MEARRRTMFGVAHPFAFFTIFLIFITPLHGEGLYTRTDELSCGDTLVQAFTTCTEDSIDAKTARCFDQHFFFVNKKTGAFTRMEGSGKYITQRDPGGKIEIQYEHLATAWACETGETGLYIYVGVAGSREKQYIDIWDELWDLKGRRLASTKGDTDEIWKRFYKIWISKGLATHPLPIYDFVPIQTFKTDTVHEYDPWKTPGP